MNDKDRVTERVPPSIHRGCRFHQPHSVKICTQAMILPGVTIGEGAIVAGVPTKSIGERTHDLTYALNYRKFLG